jgi:hypothetical protein
MAQGKAGLGPRLGFGACCPTAPTGPPPHRMDRQQERAAVIPAQPGAPANIGQPGQPSGPTAFGLPRREAGAVEGVRGTAWGRQELDEGQTKGPQRLRLLPHLPMAGCPGGPLGKRCPQVALGIAGKAPCPPKALPWPTQRPGHSLAPAERGLRPRVARRGQGRLAKGLDHDGERSEEGGHIDHRGAPYSGENSAIL